MPVTGYALLPHIPVLTPRTTFYAYGYHTPYSLPVTVRGSRTRSAIYTPFTTYTLAQFATPPVVLRLRLVARCLVVACLILCCAVDLRYLRLLLVLALRLRYWLDTTVIPLPFTTVALPLRFAYGLLSSTPAYTVTHTTHLHYTGYAHRVTYTHAHTICCAAVLRFTLFGWLLRFAAFCAGAFGLRVWLRLQVTAVGFCVVRLFYTHGLRLVAARSAFTRAAACLPHGYHTLLPFPAVWFYRFGSPPAFGLHGCYVLPLPHPQLPPHHTRLRLHGCRTVRFRVPYHTRITVGWLRLLLHHAVAVGYRLRCPVTHRAPSPHYVHSSAFVPHGLPTLVPIWLVTLVTVLPYTVTFTGWFCGCLPRLRLRLRAVGWLPRSRSFTGSFTVGLRLRYCTLRLDYTPAVTVATVTRTRLYVTFVGYTARLRRTPHILPVAGCCLRFTLRLRGYTTRTRTVLHAAHYVLPTHTRLRYGSRLRLVPGLRLPHTTARGSAPVPHTLPVARLQVTFTGHSLPAHTATAVYTFVATHCVLDSLAAVHG